MDINRLHQLFELDAEKGVLLRRFARGGFRAGDPVGTVSQGYLRAHVDGCKVMAHRIVYAMAYGTCPDVVDHINGNTLDNRPANLRAATRAENMQNRRAHANCASGVKGVYWSAAKQKWRAECRANGKCHRIGDFKDLESADRAVRAARERLHGEFARHA